MSLGTCVRVAAIAATLALAAVPARADDYQETVDRAYAELQQFKDWLQTHLDEVEEEVVELKQELAESEASDKARIEEMLSELDEQTSEIEAKLAALQETTEDQWQRAKASALSSWHRVQAAYYAALAELRD